MEATEFTAALKAKGLPDRYGEGWLSNNAHDLLQITILFGGYERDDLLQRITGLLLNGRQKINLRDIEDILQDLYEGNSQR